MTRVELRGVGDGLERLEEHGEPAQQSWSAAVQYHGSVRQQIARVVWPFRHLHNTAMHHQGTYTATFFGGGEG